MEDSTRKKEDGKKTKPLAIPSQEQREAALSRLKEARKKEEETLKIGKTIPGKGVFIGVWAPKDRDGKSLGKIFNVFAAPQDLTDASGQKALLDFNEAVKRVAELKNWHGHHGGTFTNDTAVYDALRYGSYKGEWFIPTRDILDGKDLDGKDVQPDNLYRHKDTGALKGTFITDDYSGLAKWYWSCTDAREISFRGWDVKFSNGESGPHYRDNFRQSCRPVRVEPRP